METNEGGAEQRTVRSTGSRYRGEKCPLLQPAAASQELEPVLPDILNFQNKSDI